MPRSVTATGRAIATGRSARNCDSQNDRLWNVGGLRVAAPQPGTSAKYAPISVAEHVRDVSQDLRNLVKVSRHRHFFLREQPREFHVVNGAARYADSTYCRCRAWVRHIEYNKHARAI